jgi:hypothetical protein
LGDKNEGGIGGKKRKKVRKHKCSQSFRECFHVQEYLIITNIKIIRKSERLPILDSDFSTDPAIEATE